MSDTQELSKQQLKSKETKGRIFRAAKTILQEKGYEALSIKNICEEAGVSNGSFYHHFKTKDDLLSYYIEEQPSINPDLLDLPGSAEEAITTIVHVYLNYVEYCKELGLEFISNYYTPKNQSLNPIFVRTSLSDSDCTQLSPEINRCRSNCTPSSVRGCQHRYPYDRYRKCIRMVSEKWQS